MQDCLLFLHASLLPHLHLESLQVINVLQVMSESRFPLVHIIVVLGSYDDSMDHSKHLDDSSLYKIPLTTKPKPTLCNTAHRKQAISRPTLKYR